MKQYSQVAKLVDAIQRRKCSNTEGHSRGMQEAKT